jgi:hypothetical protein
VNATPRDLTVTVDQFQRNFDVMLDRVEAGGVDLSEAVDER